MRHRCLGKTRRNYEHYFLKGITVCKEWSEYETFLSDMGEPGDGQELDRIDNLKGYSKDNCRWVTRSQQLKNRSPLRHRNISKRNKSSRVGVCLLSRANKWKASYGRETLVITESYERAVMARLSKEIEVEVIESGLFKSLC